MDRLHLQTREPSGSANFVELADSLRRERRFEEALRVLREGFRAYPDLAEARAVLARIHLEMGNRPLAVEVLVEVVQGDPDQHAAAAQLVRLLVEDGRFAEARPIFERLHEAGAADDALRALAGGLVGAPARPEDPFETAGVALRLARAGHPHRAWKLLERLRAARPADPHVCEAHASVEGVLAGLDRPLAESHASPTLPGVGDAWRALLDDTLDRPPPAGEHPVARWGRRVWRAS